MFLIWFATNRFFQTFSSIRIRGKIRCKKRIFFRCGDEGSGKNVTNILFPTEIRNEVVMEKKVLEGNETFLTILMWVPFRVLYYA